MEVELEDRVDRLEALFGQFMAQTNRALIRMERGEEFYEYFPRYKEKKLIPVFSSLYLPPDVVTRLSRNGIYAMAMSDSAVDILNYEECTLSKTH